MKKYSAHILLLALFLAVLTACGGEDSGAEPSMLPDVTPPVTGTVPAEESAEPDTGGGEGTMLNIQVGDALFTATLAENSSVDAFRELFTDGPLTLEMKDFAGMEKGADLGVDLPRNDRQMDTQAGDIILYQGRTFVIYYDTNSWSLTPIGKIDGVDAEALREALGDGDVTVTLSLE